MRDRLARAMTLLGETFNEVLSDAKLEAYALALAHEPIERLEAAVPELLRTSAYFPRPAEWLTAAREVALQRPKIPADRGLPGWVRDPSLPEWAPNYPVSEDDNHRCMGLIQAILAGEITTGQAQHVMDAMWGPMTSA